MKKRVSIYIDDNLWDDIKESAWRDKLSASAWIAKRLMFAWQVDESAGYFSDSEGAKALEPNKKINSAIRGMVNALADEDVDLEAEELRQANERLLKKRTEIKGAIKTASDLPSQFKMNPQPKAKWKGAK